MVALAGIVPFDLAVFPLSQRIPRTVLDGRSYRAESAHGARGRQQAPLLPASKDARTANVGSPFVGRVLDACSGAEAVHLPFPCGRPAGPPPWSARGHAGARASQPDEALHPQPSRGDSHTPRTRPTVGTILGRHRGVDYLSRLRA